MKVTLWYYSGCVCTIKENHCFAEIRLKCLLKYAGWQRKMRIVTSDRRNLLPGSFHVDSDVDVVACLGFSSYFPRIWKVMKHGFLLISTNFLEAQTDISEDTQP